ncbi:MAG: methionyl-tRNA formyltransferase [Candidatus Berkelbacteria bacterium]|nr:methionyl-tRNA formyltransferase [Candidatus Berkelbacteria bacterium]
MKIVFFGSSKYSTIVENALYNKFGLSLVVTLPDRPTGRNKKLTANPVKIFATKNNIPSITAEKLDKLIVEQIKKVEPDFLVVADYGLILPREIFFLPKHVSLNVHHSLLPKYRGPSPATTAILNGEKISGVTVIKMNEKVDAGDILSQKEYELKPDETTDSLLTKLNTLGGEIIISVIENYVKKNVKAVKQDESKASYTKMLEKKDGYIDIDNSPSSEILYQMIRAFYPWPGVWTRLRLGFGGQAKLKIIRFLPERKIQVEGKNPMSYKDFLNGYSWGKSILEKLNL